MNEDCSNLSRSEYRHLLDESKKLAMALYNHDLDMLEYRTQLACRKAWQRHWRRVVKYNALFDANLYVPDWYLADIKEK